MLSEKETQAIRTEARALLQRFGKVLEGVKEIPSVKREAAVLRSEGKETTCDPDFRSRMFANAPHISRDCIVAEKARW